MLTLIFNSVQFTQKMIKNNLFTKHSIITSKPQCFIKLHKMITPIKVRVSFAYFLSMPKKKFL